ncbi:MAG: Uma2 family endonuclease [Sphingobacteriaceae bacterium]|nr:Uma2 family endonuclease [Cytophagaceae bacterium]
MEAVLPKIPLTLAERDDAPELIRVPATLEEYWELSELTEYNIEYFNGEIIAMGQATPIHESLIMRLGTMFTNFYDSFEDYQVLGSNVKIYAEACVAAFNADFSVAREPYDFVTLPSGRLSTVAIKNPELVGEVFSPSTKRFDQSDKLDCYKTIPTLRHVLFVDQKRPFATVHSRTETPNRWISEDYRSLDDTIHLGELALPMREIYRKIKFGETA